MSIHERRPYRLLRFVEQMYRDLAADAKREAGRAREQGDEQEALAFDALRDARLNRAAELKAAAEEVKKPSYQGVGDKVRWSAPLVAETIATRRVSDEPLLDIPLDKRINHHTQERGSELDLPVWCKWHIGDSFKNALKAYSKKIRYAPRYKRGLDAVHIEQRTDSGKGWQLDELFAKRKAFSIRPEVNGTYEGWEAQGWFSIKNTRIPLRVIMHRPLPPGAIVKRYSLIGRYEASMAEWKRRIIFQLEVPPQPVLYSLTNRAIAIDLGWRAVESGIRCFVIPGLVTSLHTCV